MTELTLGKRSLLQPLFAGNDKTMVLSFLQGYRGRAWADHDAAPACARIDNGDFCFFAGSSSAPEARELVRFIPTEYSSPDLLMIPPDEGWAALIEQEHPGRAERIERYALKHSSSFDLPLLGQAAQPPAGFRLCAVDEALYHKTFEEEWSRDFCSQFPSWNRYREQGLGFLLLKGDALVSGASSYLVCGGAVEIQVATSPAYQRMGLARVCSARLMLECLQKNLLPLWDAANRASLALAESLGYRPAGTYTAYAVRIAQEK